MFELAVVSQTPQVHIDLRIALPTTAIYFRSTAAIIHLENNRFDKIKEKLVDRYKNDYLVLFID